MGCGWVGSPLVPALPPLGLLFDGSFATRLVSSLPCPFECAALELPPPWPGSLVALALVPIAATNTTDEMNSNPPPATTAARLDCPREFRIIHTPVANLL